MTNTEFDKLLEEWLESHKEEMKKELGLWVAHPSVSRADLAEKNAPYGPDCRKMLDFALERGKHYGFKTEDYEGYCGAIIYGDSKEEIGFACHLDVVPEGDHWIYKPYEMSEKDGYLIGRGVSDDKGPTISCLFLMRFFKENNIPLNNTLRLMAGCAEETGMADFKWYVNEFKGVVPKFSIVADCGFPVCFAQKGGYDAAFKIPMGKNVVDIFAGNVRNAIPDEAYMVISGIDAEKAADLLAEFDNIKLETLEDGNVKLSAFGKGGHAAAPEGKKNALVYLSEVASELESKTELDLGGVKFIYDGFYSPYGEGFGIDNEDEKMGKLTINAGVIRKHGDSAQLEIDIRYPHSSDPKEITVKLSSLGEKYGSGLINISVASPYYIDPEDEKVLTLLKVYNELTGEDAKPYSMGGGTYSRVIPNAMSFGPGFKNGKAPEFLPEGHGGAHGPDEVNCLEDWFTSFKIYVKSVYELDKIL